MLDEEQIERRERMNKGERERIEERLKERDIEIKRTNRRKRRIKGTNGRGREKEQMREGV